LSLYLGVAELLLTVVQSTIWPCKMGHFAVPPFTILLKNTYKLRNVNWLNSKTNTFLKECVYHFQYVRCLIILYYIILYYIS
jgi:hypothetical protein